MSVGPRLEPFGPVLLAGIVRRHAIGPDDEVLSSAVAKQWRDLLIDAFRFGVLLPPRGYGLGLNFAPDGDTLEFFCGFVLRNENWAPIGLECIAIPAVTCAVFGHRGPIARLRHTLDAIFATALPLEGLSPLGGETPSFILRARPSFNPLNGFGGIDVLVPVNLPA